jgi:hypothetical protein
MLKVKTFAASVFFVKITSSMLNVQVLDAVQDVGDGQVLEPEQLMHPLEQVIAESCFVMELIL